MDARVDDDFWTRALARKNLVWDEPAIELLKKLWLVDQLSASQCGLHFGVTNCAIVGKVRRLGIQKRERWAHILEAKAKGIKITRKPKPRKTARRAGVRAKPVREPVFRVRPIRPFAEMSPVSDPSLDLALRTELSCDIVGLTHNNCHWPVGDPGSASFFFCGQEAIKGKPYCGAHCRVAYEPRKGQAPRFQSRSGTHFVGRV
jgi:GcrA cell cycle regulator